MTLYNF